MMDNKNFDNIFIEILQSVNIKLLFKNIETNIETYKINNHTFFSTVTNDVINNNCYVVSPYALIINYSKEELYKLKNPLLANIFLVIINIFSFILKLLDIDKIQILNNYMLSTNFFRSSFNIENFEKLLQEAQNKYPDHALAVRSVNKVQNPELFDYFVKQNWLPIVTRQVYIMKDFDFSKRDIKRDLKLLEESRYIFVEPDLDNLEHFRLAENFFNQLYLNKYTRENVQYSALLLQKLCQHNLMHMRLLFNTIENKFVGVVGIIGDNGVITAPIVGYDLQIGNDEFLYRRCLIYIIKYAHDEQLFLNLSSGVPDYKTNRGAKGEIEYMFVNVTKLKSSRKILWKILLLISLKIYKPILIKNKL